MGAKLEELPESSSSRTLSDTVTLLPNSPGRIESLAFFLPLYTLPVCYLQSHDGFLLIGGYISLNRSSARLFSSSCLCFCLSCPSNSSTTWLILRTSKRPANCCSVESSLPMPLHILKFFTMELLYQSFHLITIFTIIFSHFCRKPVSLNN